jgi:mono/diheme cytochrome c family protein
VFKAKGCVACHTIGKGRLVGPDLKGLPQRREYGWYVAMVTNPDSMLRNDPIAKQLLAEHFTPMTNQNVTAEDARAIYEYLRDESQAEEEEGEEADET